MLSIGDDAPDFELPDQNGETVSSSVFAGRWGVLWWYPEANSGGCSMQASSLSRSYEELQARDVALLGASFNSVAENDDFACDKAPNLTLLSDPGRVAGERYQVVREPGERFDDKPRRFTYYIDPAGKVALVEDANEFPLNLYGPHVVETVDRLRTDAGE
jgi:peroxiredoxin Q/BCP